MSTMQLPLSSLLVFTIVLCCCCIQTASAYISYGSALRYTYVHGLKPNGAPKSSNSTVLQVIGGRYSDNFFLVAKGHNCSHPPMTPTLRTWVQALDLSGKATIDPSQLNTGTYQLCYKGAAYVGNPSYCPPVKKKAAAPTTPAPTIVITTTAAPTTTTTTNAPATTTTTTAGPTTTTTTAGPATTTTTAAPTPAPTAAPTAAPTPAPLGTRTRSRTLTASASPSVSSTGSPSASQSQSVSQSVSQSQTASPSVSVSPSVTATITPAPTATQSVSPTRTNCTNTGRYFTMLPWQFVVSSSVSPFFSQFCCTGPYVAGEVARCTISLRDETGALAGNEDDICKIVICPLQDGQGNDVVDYTLPVMDSFGEFSFTFLPTLSGSKGTAGIKYDNQPLGFKRAYFQVKPGPPAVNMSTSSCRVEANSSTTCAITQRDAYSNGIKECLYNSDGGAVVCNQIN